MNTQKFIRPMKTIALTVTLSIGLMACSNGSTESRTDTSNKTQESTVSQQPGVLDIYMQLKDAFVKSDAATAKTSAQALVVALKSKQMSSQLIEAAGTIAASDDLKAQRTAFKSLTDGLIEVLKSNDEEEGIYVQYCPMAFDNTGANWLSNSEEIRNPYFGDMMLKCGKVEEKL